MAIPCGLTENEIEVLRRTMEGISSDELFRYLKVCEETQLDPWTKQVTTMAWWDGEKKRKVHQPILTVEGLLVLANRTGLYAGLLGPFWCGPDGDWRDIWLENEPPRAARVGIIRHDFREVLWSVAHWRESVQTDRAGNPLSMWGTMPAKMLGKVAIADAVRRAFPMDLSGWGIAEGTSPPGPLSVHGEGGMEAEVPVDVGGPNGDLAPPADPVNGDLYPDHDPANGEEPPPPAWDDEAPPPEDDPENPFGEEPEVAGEEGEEGRRSQEDLPTEVGAPSEGKVGDDDWREAKPGTIGVEKAGILDARIQRALKSRHTSQAALKEINALLANNPEAIPDWTPDQHRVMSELITRIFDGSPRPANEQMALDG